MPMSATTAKERENRATPGFGSGHLSFRLPSSLSSIGNAIRKLSQFLKAFQVSELARTRATIVLRELMVNAITHGNKGDDTVPVLVVFEHVRDDQFRIVVEDMGSGFNYANIDTAIPDNPKAIPNRGYALVKACTDRFEFNEKGNRVSAYFSA